MVNNLRPLSIACLTGLLVPLLAPGPASATETAVYGDLTGDTVVYRNVLESGDALLNAPIIVGDRLVFQPSASDFQAVSFGGADQELTNTVATVLVARPGSALGQVTVEGSGLLDFFALGNAATAATAVQAQVTITARVIDYVDTDGNPSFGNDIALTPQTTLLADLQFDGSDERNRPWGGLTTLDLAGLAASEALIDGLLTRVSLTVNTTLRAFSETSGTQSQISLREFDTLTITTVPEPVSAALLLAPLTLCIRRRRRRF